MPRIKAGEVELGYRIWGGGPVTVVFIHGNLASKDWIEAAANWFPPDLRVIGIDWRGCGDSDKPMPLPDFSNYAVEQHAADMMAALDALKVERCHLATHSTGGIIAAHMQLAQPGRFGRVLHLDPVSPMGLKFEPTSMAMFEAMKSSRDTTRSVMAGVASSLFRPESFGINPVFRDNVDTLGSYFDRMIDQTFAAGEGIWMGTPLSLTRTHESGGLAARLAELTHPALILWGALDPVIPRADMVRMAEALPDARLVEVPGIGHSMNLEAPQMYAAFVAALFSGVTP